MYFVLIIIVFKLDLRRNKIYLKEFKCPRKEDLAALCRNLTNTTYLSFVQKSSRLVFQTQSIVINKNKCQKPIRTNQMRLF